MTYLPIIISIFLIISLLLFWKRDFFRRRRSKDPEAILMRAQTKAGRIIQEAIERARGVEIEASYVGQDFKDELKKNLRDLLKETEDEFREEYTSAVRQTLADLSRASSKEAGELRGDLQKDIVESQKELDKKIEAEWDKAKQEIQEYKKQQIDTLNGRIDIEVLRLSKEILGRALKTEEHEKLVFEALEEAKAEGVFEKL